MTLLQGPKDPVLLTLGHVPTSTCPQARAVLVSSSFTCNISSDTKFDITPNDDKTKITSLSGYPQLCTA